MSSMNNLTCILPEVPVGTDAVSFQNTPIIERVHESTPRFGHTSNIDDLLFGTQDEKKDYVWGLIASTVAIGVFVIVWLVFICSCRCLGPKRVGFLSGKPYEPTKPERSSSMVTENIEMDQDGNDIQYETAMAQYQKQTQRRERRMVAIRIIMLVCSAGIVAMAVLMIVKGVQGLSLTLDKTSSGVDVAKDLTQQAVGLVDDFVARTNETVQGLKELLNSTNDICPNRGEICTNLNVNNNSDVQEICDFEGLPNAEELENILKETKPDDLMLDDLMDIRKDLIEFYEALEYAQETANSVTWAFWVMVAFVALLALLNIFIISGVIAAWRHKKPNCIRKFLKCMRSWLLVPIFGFLVILCWIFSMVFVVGSTAAADACVDDPDARVQQVLTEYGDSLDSTIYAFLIFYINGCVAEDAPLVLSETLVQVSDAYAHVVDFVNAFVNDTAVDGAVTEFEQICGTDPSLATGIAQLLVGTICNMGETLIDIQNYFSCENWRPLYVAIVYDAVCYQGNDALYWISITMFVTVVLALVMLTLRAAFATTFGTDDDEAAAPMEGDAVMVDEEPLDATRDSNDDGMAPSAPSDQAGWTAYDDGPKASVY